MTKKSIERITANVLRGRRVKSVPQINHHFLMFLFQTNTSMYVNEGITDDLFNLFKLTLFENLKKLLERPILLHRQTEGVLFIIRDSHVIKGHTGNDSSSVFCFCEVI
jgi:hypothetical protein